MRVFCSKTLNKHFASFASAKLKNFKMQSQQKDLSAYIWYQHFRRTCRPRPLTLTNVWATAEDVFQFPESSPPPYYVSDGTDISFQQYPRMTNSEVSKQQLNSKAGLRVVYMPPPSYSQADSQGTSTTAPPAYEEGAGSPKASPRCANRSAESMNSGRTVL